MPDRLPRVLTLVAFLVGVGVITGAAMVPTAPFDTMATSIRIAKNVDRTSAHPGDTVTYTVTVTNTGTTAIDGAAISDDLSDVVDDATFNSASADRGTTSYSSPTLQWQGDLPSGAKATISYSVRVADPPTGDDHLDNRITSTTAGNNCPSGNTDAACAASTPVSST
ncbi:DUF7507 domain-containing protein [Streptomyces aureoversilis]|uniref:DUF7927 domain-containing protein n=1 Tax=Streptomyces aureoversilis TaxID=67277 RepID=A0ABW0AAN1_9ACTN